MSATSQIARKERGALLQNQRGLGWLLAFSAVLSAFALLLTKPGNPPALPGD